MLKNIYISLLCFAHSTFDHVSFFFFTDEKMEAWKDPRLPKTTWRDGEGWSWVQAGVSPQARLSVLAIRAVVLETLLSGTCH